jgi:transcriptional regulator with XRE-family HTH domain
MVSPAQVRAARALLNWSQDDLARRSNLTRQTIRIFETAAHRPRGRTEAAIRTALEHAGISFVDTDVASGVLLDRAIAG